MVQSPFTCISSLSVQKTVHWDFFFTYLKMIWTLLYNIHFWFTWFWQHEVQAVQGQLKSFLMECQCYSHVFAVAVVTHVCCAVEWVVRNGVQEEAPWRSKDAAAPLWQIFSVWLDKRGISSEGSKPQQMHQELFLQEG